MPLLADRTTPEGVRVIEASGELDRVELPYLRSSLQHAFAEGLPAVILDMSAVTYIDSSVLAGLIAESLDADQRGAKLFIVTGLGGIMRSLELKGLTQVMHITESVDQALEQLRS
jgi:anti-sigma B factor antagonist